MTFKLQATPPRRQTAGKRVGLRDPPVGHPSWGGSELRQLAGGASPPRVLQPKLEVGAANDLYEREADRVADDILRMPPGSLGPATDGVMRRRCTECEEEQGDRIRRQPAAGRPTAIPGSGSDPEKRLTDLSRQGGRPLTTSERTFFEPRFTADFSGVRIHDDEEAAEAATTLQARAFTAGRDIVFGADEYSPGNRSSRHLLAHELTHVLQQDARQGPAAPALQRQPAKQDLQSPRFKGDPVLEAVLDGERELKRGDRGEAVRKIQRALIDAGHPLRIFGADSSFGEETETSVKRLQEQAGLDNGIRRGKGLVDGVVRTDTMRRLDQIFPAGARRAGTPPPEPEDFRVLGKLERPSFSARRFFFDFDSATLDEEEQERALFAVHPVGFRHPFFVGADEPLDLMGFASEEGSPAYNRQLARRRIAAVDEALGRRGHIAKRTPVVDAEAGVGRVDYRFMRAVQLVTSGSPSTTPKCTGNDEVQCPSPHEKLTEALDKADQMLGGAIEALTASSLEPAVIDLLDRLFGGTTAAPKLIPILRDLRKHMKQNMPRQQRLPDGKTIAGHRCVNNCNSACAAGAPAFNGDSGRNALMTLCPVFQQRERLPRADILIHEGTHGTEGLEASDFARRFQRLILFLDQEDALRNSDSITLFVLELDSPETVPIGPRKSDFADKIGLDEFRGARRALAFVEVWVNEAAGQTTVLHNVVDSARRSRRWPNSFYQFTMSLLAPRFGLTAPPRAPTMRDQSAVAAIHDRYEQMSKGIERQVRIGKTTAGLDNWSAGPGDAVKLSSSFFDLPTDRARVDFLLALLVAATPNISEPFELKYVEFADLNREQHGFPDP